MHVPIEKTNKSQLNTTSEPVPDIKSYTSKNNGSPTTNAIDVTNQLARTWTSEKSHISKIKKNYIEMMQTLYNNTSIT